MSSARWPLLAAAASAGLLAGCAVGPDFHKPAPPPTDRYTTEATPRQLVADASAANPTQTLNQDLDIPGEWWGLFHSKPLNLLITDALAHNPDLAAAQAALRQARENVYAQEGNYLPSLSGSFQPSRNKTATSTITPVAANNNPYYSLYTAQLNVSYNPDVFGLNRRQTESLVALSDMQRQQLEATYLTLTANLVAAAVTEASLRQQIAATHDIVAIERDLLRILQTQLRFGQIAGVDVLAQVAATAQAEASLPPLERQLAVDRDLIAALSGRLPSQGVPETFDLASLHLPQELPLSLPSRLVEQRPDVRQAEANLHSASALVGVAVANRLPVLSLSAFGGSESLKAGDLFSPGTGFWTLAGTVTQPIFEGGILLHKERAARAALQQAAAQYSSTVVTAFQNVADALRALQTDADAVRVATLADQAAGQTLVITRRQLGLGQVSYLLLLSAEQADLQARLTLVQSQALRLSDTAGLFQALGGGWWNRNDSKVRDPHGNDPITLVGLR